MKKLRNTAILLFWMAAIYIHEYVVKPFAKYVRETPRAFLARVAVVFFSLQCFAIEPTLAAPVPVDIPLTGPGGTLAPPKTPVYNTTGAQNTTIDPTVTPPSQTGLTNIPIPSTTGRIGTNAPYNGSASPFCLTVVNGGTCLENKFRTQVDFQYMLPDDPIRNFGQPGQSHLHCFFGGGSVNAYSTYKTLRKHALSSFAAGTDVNNTGYWMPCFVVLDPYGNGKNYALKPDYVVVYYTENPATNNPKVGLPTGTRYVFGFDMDSSSPSTQFAWLQTILNAANTAQGRTRYTLTSPSGRYASQALYTCQGATPASSNYHVMPDGSDPFGGTCNSGQEYGIDISGPKCWDGDTLHSDGGYKHLIPGVYDNDYGKFVCPTNYYTVPDLVVKPVYKQYGWADRQRWVLSSDLAYRAMHGLNATQVPAGMTFHTDWMDGWDITWRHKWEQNCFGTLGNIGHECNTSQVSSTEWLRGGNAGEAGVSRTPQVDLTPLQHTNETDAGWMLIPPSWSGSLTGHVIHP